MRAKLKAIGTFVLYLAVLVGIGLIATMLIHGGVRLGALVYPWLERISEYGLAVSVLGLLPLAAFKETRGHAGVGLFIASFVFGATLWVWSLLLTYELWGGVALFVGLIIAGVGVLPIAMLATAFKGMWSEFGFLVLMLVATFGSRLFGLYLVNKAEEHEYDALDPVDGPHSPNKLIVASSLLFVASFVPYVAYLTSIPLIICSIVLCFSKTRRARRHGLILLSIVLLWFVVFISIGYFLGDRLSGGV
jgi:hypothetical protein